MVLCHGTNGKYRTCRGANCAFGLRYTPGLKRDLLYSSLMAHTNDNPGKVVGLGRHADRLRALSRKDGWILSCLLRLFHHHLLGLLVIPEVPLKGSSNGHFPFWDSAYTSPKGEVEATADRAHAPGRQHTITVAVVSCAI